MVFKIPSYLEELVDSVPNNSTLRFNCPNELCKGHNSLGITKEKGKVQWNCFKCSKVKGKTEYQRNMSELKSSLRGHTEGLKEFKLPEHLIYGLGSKKTISLVKKYHLEETYSKGLFDLAYDPVENRVCFLIKKNNKFVGLIGRTLDSGSNIKTLNYPNSDISTPFTCGNSDVVVLVEDCISAASVARIEVTGLALLGSTLKDDYITAIKPYKTVVVALDRDARKKALAIKKKLEYYHSNIKLWLLEQDIKDMNDEQLLKSYNYERNKDKV